MSENREHFLPVAEKQWKTIDSNVVYYPLAQQSTLQQPVFLTSAAGSTAATWPTNLFSQFNLANLTGATTSNNNLSSTLTNPGTTSTSQAIYDAPTALFDSTTAATGQQLYWPAYN